MDVDDLLIKECNKFREGYFRVWERRRQWPAFEKRAEQLFNELINKSKQHNLFENLYIITNSNEAEFNHAPFFITLKWGGHPVGANVIEGDRDAIEKGCALHFAQDVCGRVVCIVYPFISELHSLKEKYYIIKIYRDPNSIFKKELEKAVKEMFFYAQISSYLGNPDFFDHARLLWRNLLSKLRELRYHSVLVPIISLLAKVAKFSHTATP